LILNISLQDK